MTEIKYKGKTYLYKVGYLAFKRVKESLGREFDEVDVDYEATEELLKYSILNECEKNGKEFDLNTDDIENIIDENITLVNKAIDEFRIGLSKIIESKPKRSLVATIDYKEKTYPFKFGYKVMKRVKIDIGRDFIYNPNEMDYQGFESMVYHGIKVECEKSDIPFDLKKDEIEYFIDETFFEIISALLSFSPAAGIRRAAKKK